MVIVSFGALSVRTLRGDGAIPEPGQFERAARQAQSSLRACYVPVLSWDPDLKQGSGPSGTVLTNLVIDENGRVVTAGNAASTFRAPEIALCVMKALQAVSYPVRPGLGAVGAQVPIGFSWRGESQ